MLMNIYDFLCDIQGDIKMATKIRFLIFIISLAYISCQDMPTKSSYTNPLDSENPHTGGDPFKLKARIANGGISLTWSEVTIKTIIGYNIYRSIDKSDNYVRLDSAIKGTTTWTDTAVTNGHTYWYKVTAFGNEAIESSRSNVVPVVINTTPVIVINAGDEYAISRKVQLTILAGAATQMWLSNHSDFSESFFGDYISSKDWILTKGGGTKTVYLKVKYADESISSVIFDTIEPQPITKASISINNNARYASKNETILSISVDGAQFMKIAEDSTFSGLLWVPFAADTIFQLSPDEGDKAIYFQFKNDFELVSPIFHKNITLDLTRPKAIFSVRPDSGVTNETDFEFDATKSTDNLSHYENIEVRWDWENDGNYDADWTRDKRITHRYSEGGTKTIKLQIRDGAGWLTEYSQTIFVNSRPVAQFSVSPPAGEDTTVFYFDASASSEPDADKILFRWDFQGDKIWEIDWSVEKNVSYQFAQGGNYLTRLEVKDSYGLINSYQQYVIVFYASPMVYIPAGEFTMGSKETGRDEEVGDSDEHPLHNVYLGDFYIDKYEVTNAQYSQFLTAGNSAHYYPEMQILNRWDGSFVAKEGYENHPVIFVTYNDALEYAHWRGKSLPTEAQWEKAARGTDMRLYPWGNILEKNRLNYWGSDDPFENVSGAKTVPIGFYDGANHLGYQTKDSPSPYGTYDMAGNLWEWCSDWYQADYYSHSPSQNPTGASSGSFRVIRGGSWADEIYYVRTTCRSHHLPSDRSPTIGFRCVK